MSAAAPFRPALALSLALHLGAALVLVVALRDARLGPARGAELGASFWGETFEVDEVLSPPAAVAPAVPNGPGPSEPAVTDPASQSASTAPQPAERRPKKSLGRPTPPPSAAPKPSSAPATPRAPSEPSAAQAGSGALGDGTSQPAASADTSPGAPAAQGAGASGMTGAAASTADLAKAFAKAVTAATHRDSIWDELPLGPAGSARVVITVDDQGRIDSSVVAEADKVAPPIARLVERTLALLRAGRFALAGRELGPGSQTLRVDVVLLRVAPEDDYDDPRHTVSLGFDPPRPGAPGRAYFVHAAGRRFEATITVE